MKKDLKETERRQAAEWRLMSRYLDVSYSYLLAKRMEQFFTNPVLGFRTAGSKAEADTGEFLAAEMRAIGLEVQQDEFHLDGWDFHHARLSWTAADGAARTAELGSYQTSFDTRGKRVYKLINAGRATAEELERLDLRGKLALVAVNQRDDWWINYPAYAAHLRGAAAILAVQMSGYSEASAKALNAQDICGPADAPAFSISKKDAKRLLQDRELAFGQETEVTLDALSTVTRDTTACNIVGSIPGREPDSMILVSAHYDSYFQGFQDDNTAVTLMLCMARALKLSGYQPQKTLVFCAMAAEEWGVVDSRYDWSTGAYNEVFRLHPDWCGKVVADINLELPAHAHGKKHKIRSVYELKRFLQQQIRTLPENMAKLYPKGIGVICPVETWSDDFSIAIAGIPSMVNEFGEGSFMETHYHSQYDNDGAYDEQVYLFHHLLYSRLLLALDKTALPPLDFAERLTALSDSVRSQRLTPVLEGALRRALASAAERAARLTEAAEEINAQYFALLGRDPEAAHELFCAQAERAAGMLAAFRFCEDVFVRLDWGEHAGFPHERQEANLDHLHRAAWQLAAGDPDAALDSLCCIDDNRYAAAFDPAVVEYFADRARSQPPERLMWGAGRLPERLPLRDMILQIRARAAAGGEDYGAEITALHELQKEGQRELEQILRAETADLQTLSKQLKKLLPKEPAKGGKKKKKKKAARRGKGGKAAKGAADLDRMAGLDKPGKNAAAPKQS